MKRRWVACAMAACVGASSPAPSFGASTTPVRVQLPWTLGWDSTTEPLDMAHSSLTWSYDPLQGTLTVDVALVHATPGKVYQVGVNIYCTVFFAQLGQFPTANVGAGNACLPLTKQGVTANTAQVELGVVLTDNYGNGALSVQVVRFPSAPSGRKVEFFVRNGTSCNLPASIGDDDCTVDFQSPGPTFGSATTIIAP